MQHTTYASNELDLTNIHELRALFSFHNMRANKAFGQNFLIDRAILQTMLEAAQIDPHDQILEVGAGTGVLTRELARQAQRVVAVEVERDMLTLLKETIGHLPNVELVEGDVLFFDPVRFFGQDAYKLVANLPYYITAPTFRHFLESGNPPRLLIVMVQLEVAQRITAAPGDLSLLGISVQFYGQPSIVARVPAQAFYPAPKVDSAILRIEMRPTVQLTLEERNRFFRLVQAGFTERRKQLHNSLTHALHQKNEQIRAWLAAAGIDANRRAETLSIEEWLQLWRIIENQ